MKNLKNYDQFIFESEDSEKYVLFNTVISEDGTDEWEVHPSHKNGVSKEEAKKELEKQKELWKKEKNSEEYKGVNMVFRIISLEEYKKFKDIKKGSEFLEKI